LRQLVLTAERTVARAGDVKEVLTAELRLENAPLQARENVGIAEAHGRMLSSVRPLMRQDDSRRPVWEFADRVQITLSVLEALWKALVVPAPSDHVFQPFPIARTMPDL
jgi:hypothetical protein